jgi:hypothetical protein
MKKRLLYIACLLALAACAKVEPVPGPVPDDGERKEIAFRANMDQDGGWVNLQTKADVSLDDLKSGGWGLYGYYTKTADYTKPSEADGVLFNGPDSHGRQVRWDGTNSVWEYAIDADHKKEYWPMDPDEKVSFFAYAPYSLYSANATVDNDNGPQVTYTATTDMTAQKDLLWGTNTSGLPHRNVNLATFQDPSTNPNGNVDMHFRHAPAKIHFTINGATLGDQNGQAQPQGNATQVGQPTYGNNSIIRSNEATGGTYTTGYPSRTYTLYWAYRTKTVVTTQTYQQDISGFKILLNSVEMTNFIKNGVLHLNNPDAYSPNWSVSGNETLTYSFTANSDLPLSISNPNNEATLSAGWGTTYLGVDADPKELLLTPNNYIYMVPKQAVNPDPNSQNITITAIYHVIGLSKRVQFTRTTTTVSYQRVEYYMNGDTPYYRTGNNSYGTNVPGDNRWTDVNNTSWPTTSSYSDGNKTNVGNPTFNYSQDNERRGFKAVGSIKTDILGGRDYTINLYLDGRELNLTVIPQPWDLHETTYDYNGFINPVEQSLTYDANFVYDVVEDKVYINNRMGKFYFRLGTGTYLYWQASLIGDDAFAFTDENGEYLRDNSGNLMTSIRGDLDGSTSYIYVKAINTASRVTSQAKLRIYLFNSENHAVVALPKDNWLFVSSTYIDGGQQKRVQEWTVVQTAN